MKEIVKVLLQEGIDEETIHEVLDILENTRDFVLKKAAEAHKRAKQDPENEQNWKEFHKYHHLFDKALDLRDEAKRNAQHSRLSKGQKMLDTERPKAERKQLDANFDKGNGSALLLPRETEQGTEQSIAKTIRKHKRAK